MPPKRATDETCNICGDKAATHNHYGAIACYSCRQFFRRASRKRIGASRCRNDGKCPITIETRAKCISCRFNKCITFGMRSDWVMSNKDVEEKKCKLEKKISQLTEYEVRMREHRFQPKQDGRSKSTRFNLLPQEEERIANLVKVYEKVQCLSNYENFLVSTLTDNHSVLPDEVETIYAHIVKILVTFLKNLENENRTHLFKLAKENVASALILEITRLIDYPEEFAAIYGIPRITYKDFFATPWAVDRMTERNFKAFIDKIFSLRMSKTDYAMGIAITLTKPSLGANTECVSKVHSELLTLFKRHVYKKRSFTFSQFIDICNQLDEMSKILLSRRIMLCSERDKILVHEKAIKGYLKLLLSSSSSERNYEWR